MKKNIEILINNKTIDVHFNNELKNHKVILKFVIVKMNFLSSTKKLSVLKK